MPRDRFISDNLVNIRDHLRQNYAAVAGVKKEESENSSVGEEIHINLKNPIAQSSSVGNRSSDREFNEFAGRLQHDLAAVAQELQQLEGKQEALAKYNAVLLDLVRLLKQLPAEDNQDFFREFDRLKMLYFQASGEVESFRSFLPQRPIVSGEKAPVDKRDWFLPCSVIVSAVILAVTLILLFA